MEEQNTKEEKETKEEKNKIQKTLNIVGKTIGWAIIIILITIIIRTLIFKQYYIFGYRCYLIGSGSMEPTINTGDAIIVKDIKKENELKEGDIIAFSENNITVVHRIIKIQSDQGKNFYQTKGDNNNTSDGGLRTKKDIKGKMTLKISNAGKVVNFIKKHTVIIISIMIVLILLILVKGFII